MYEQLSYLVVHLACKDTYYMIFYASSESFNDFSSVLSSSFVDDRYQYIAPNLTFPCDGVVTKWKIGTENENTAAVYLQMWRPDGTDYSRVTETVYTHSGGEAIAKVSTDMTVSAGDVVGFYMQGGTEGLKVAWTLVPDHTLLRGSRSTRGATLVATFSDVSTTILSSSPLVSVEFGKYAIIV